MNRIGYFSRLGYDQDCSYRDKVAESTGPLEYMLDTNKIYNCNSCQSTFGPRGTYGDALPEFSPAALSQAPEVVNIESILTNRNVKLSKCRRDGTNPIDVTKMKLKNTRVCNDYLSPESSRLSYPAANYRDVGINRFYNLPKNPQEPIYWPDYENTTLQLKDNFFDRIPEIWSNVPSLPSAVPGRRRGIRNYERNVENVAVNQPIYRTDY